MPFGYFIYAHDEDCDESPMPADLWAACVFARAAGCDYLNFDRDAPLIEGLPYHPD